MASTLILGACAVQPEPESTATPVPEPFIPSPSPTPEPTEGVAAAPERPAEMDRFDEVGAVAAAEYFLAVQAHAIQSGELGEWNRVSLADCGFCSGLRASVERVYGEGGAYVGREFTASKPLVVGHDEVLGVFAVEAEFTAAAGREVDASGETVSEISLERGFMTLDVMPVDGDWALLGVVVSDESIA